MGKEKKEVHKKDMHFLRDQLSQGFVLPKESNCIAFAITSQGASIISYCSKSAKADLQVIYFYEFLPHFQEAFHIYV